MSFILDIRHMTNPTSQDILARWKAYQEYIRSLEGKLAPRAFEYATSEWHGNYGHHMSAHDGWLERMIIEEPAEGSRGEKRTIKITIELLASYHDGRIKFTYPDVLSYELFVPKEFEFPPYEVGHGDWLADEVHLSDKGLAVHEIVFSRGARWRIEASDIHYEWLPMDK